MATVRDDQRRSYTRYIVIFNLLLIIRYLLFVYTTVLYLEYTSKLTHNAEISYKNTLIEKESFALFVT